MYGFSFHWVRIFVLLLLFTEISEKKKRMIEQKMKEMFKQTKLKYTIIVIILNRNENENILIGHGLLIISHVVHVAAYVVFLNCK